MKYAQIKDDEFYKIVPRRGKYTFLDGSSTGNIECFSEEELFAKDILPLIVEYETINKRTQENAPAEYIVGEDSVVCLYSVIDKTEGGILREYNSALDNLKSKRDALLVESDWTQVADSPLTDQVISEWVAYRQELRDLPNTLDDTHPDDAVFPERP